MMEHKIDKKLLYSYNKMQSKWITDQQNVKLTSSINQTNKYHPTTKHTNTKKRGKLRIRSKLNTKQNEDEQLKPQIKQLKEEVNVLKQQ